MRVPGGYRFRYRAWYGIRGLLIASIAGVLATACGGGGGASPGADGGNVEGAGPNRAGKALEADCLGSLECAQSGGSAVECECTDRSHHPVCSADAAEGGSCAPTGNFQPRCAPGLRCVGTLSAAGDITASCLRPGKLGDACMPTPGCDEPDYCDDTGHCALATARLGDACDWLQWSSCLSPNICDLFSGTCVAPAKLGEMCDLKDPGSRSGCVAGAGCDGIHCAPLRSDGADCVYDEECSSAYCGLAGCGRSSTTGQFICG